MKRFMAFTFTTLFIAGAWALLQKKSSVISTEQIKKKERKISQVDLSFETRKYPPVRKLKRALASSAPAARPEILTGLKISERSLPIGKSFQLVEDVVALPKEQYRKEMGKIVKNENGLIFFRPETKDIKAWPVAFHKGRQKLYPISHILHIKGVDPELREQLSQRGLSEYYYHAPLKLLSVRSTPTKVLQQYEELKSQGLTVRLEVLKETPQLK